MNHTGGNNYTYHVYHGQFFHKSLEKVSNINIINKLYLSEMTNIVNPFTHPPFLVILTQPFRHVALIISSLPHRPLPRSNLLRNPFPPWPRWFNGKEIVVRFQFAVKSYHSLLRSSKWTIRSKHGNNNIVLETIIFRIILIFFRGKKSSTLLRIFNPVKSRFKSIIYNDT